MFTYSVKPFILTLVQCIATLYIILEVNNSNTYSNINTNIKTTGGSMIHVIYFTYLLKLILPRNSAIRHISPRPPTTIQPRTSKMTSPMNMMIVCRVSAQNTAFIPPCIIQVLKNQEYISYIEYEHTLHWSICFHSFFLLEHKHDKLRSDCF